MKLRPGFLHRSGSIIPSFVAVGTFDSGTSGIDPGYPAGVLVDDLLLLLAENRPVDAALAAPSGWAHVTNSPQTETSGTTSNNTRLHVFWKRAAGGETGTVHISNPDDHASGQIASFRNVRTTGNPWDVTAGGNS